VISTFPSTIRIYRNKMERLGDAPGRAGPNVTFGDGVRKKETLTGTDSVKAGGPSRHEGTEVTFKDPDMGDGTSQGGSASNGKPANRLKVRRASVSNMVKAARAASEPELYRGGPFSTTIFRSGRRGGLQERRES